MDSLISILPLVLIHVAQISQSEHTQPAWYVTATSETPMKSPNSFLPVQAKRKHMNVPALNLRESV